MSDVTDLPLWAAIIVSVFLVGGSLLALIGCVGLHRLTSFYDRTHAPTLGASWGLALILMASMLTFTVLETRLVIHEIIIGIFVTVTTPVTLMMLGHATLFRDRAKGSKEVPAIDPPSGVIEEPGGESR